MSIKGIESDLCKEKILPRIVEIKIEMKLKVLKNQVAFQKQFLKTHLSSFKLF